MNQIDRQIDRSMKGAVDAVKGLGDAIKRNRPKVDQAMRELERMNADAVAKRFSPRKGDRIVARIELAEMGSKSGVKALKRRMERATAAASRGSKAAARAREIYGSQLAFMGPGKPAKGHNNRQPGPSNKQGPPKKRRGGGKRKPKA